MAGLGANADQTVTTISIGELMGYPFFFIVVSIHIRINEYYQVNDY